MRVRGEKERRWWKALLSGANPKHSNANKSSFTGKVRSACMFPCTIPQAALWLVTFVGVEGEEGEGDTSSTRIPTRRKRCGHVFSTLVPRQTSGMWTIL